MVDQQKRGRPADGGFTMLEVLVAMAVITTLMGSLGTFFVNGLRISREQAQAQTALRLAQAGMEAARGYGGPTLLTGRAECTASTCTNFAAFDAQGQLRDMVRWDAPGTGTPVVALPRGTGEAIPPVNGITYYRFSFVGKCWQSVTDGTCTTDSTRPVPMVRLVIGVSWTGSGCPSSMCLRTATALFSAEATEPVFAQ